MAGITIRGIDACLTRLENAEAQLTSPNSDARKALLNRLSNMAKNEMENRYTIAASSYPKEQFKEWHVEKSEKNGTEMTVTAKGLSILFLEFGTGLKRINGPTEHPEANEYGYGFRTFSATHQRHLWNPRYLKKYKGFWFEPIRGVKVSGNPPAMGWYKARELIKNHDTIKKISSEVFNVFLHAK